MGEQTVAAGPGRGVLARVLRLAAILALVAVLVPVIARATRWEAGPLAVLVSLMPWVTLATVVPVTLALLARAWAVLAASLAVMVLCLAWIAPLYVASPASGDARLTVATFSLANGGTNAEEVVAFAAQRRPDLLALTEVTPGAQERLAEAGLDRLLPHSAVLPGDWKYGIGLWSTLPLEQIEPIEGLTANALRARATVGDRPTTLVVAHPESPGLRDHSDWDADVATLLEVLEGIEGPVMLLGDLNTTRDHAGFRDLEAMGLRDAADEAGAGFLPTFPEGDFGWHRSPVKVGRPVVAIDHVLQRDTGLVAAEAFTQTVGYSDHRALVVTYRER